MRRFSHLVGGLCLVAILCFILSGCAKQQPAAAPAPAPPPPAPAAPPAPPPPPPPAPAPPPAALTEAEIFARKTLEQLNAERPLADVFFAYDSSDLNEEARGRLQTNADWMKKWNSTRVTVEGHCDSRGSSEYNIALGERRATAVRTYLTSLGIGGDRLAIVSKGEEDPVCTEEAEACWARNRRGRFLITAK